MSTQEVAEEAGCHPNDVGLLRRKGLIQPLYQRGEGRGAVVLYGADAVDIAKQHTGKKRKDEPEPEEPDEQAGPRPVVDLTSVEQLLEALVSRTKTDMQVHTHWHIEMMASLATLNEGVRCLIDETRELRKLWEPK